MPNYNRVAWIYDRLAKIVFGEKLQLAKKVFLDQIPDKSRILVVGGGTGRILNYLQELNKEFEVDFVEKSSNMMFNAKKRDIASLTVNFYHHSILDLDRAGYNVILTSFFFDQFTEERAHIILQHLKPKLEPDGILIFSDFIKTNHAWDRIVTRLMFCFFRLTANVKARNLPPYNTLFSSQGFSTGSYKKIGRNILAVTYSLVPPK